MRQSDKIINKLNELLIMNYEAEKIYLEALEHTNDDSLKTFFRERGYERNEFGRQLRSEIRNFGGEPEILGELSGDYNRIWLRFKNYLENDKEEEMLNEIYRIKDRSVKTYDKVLCLHRLPANICKVLINHRDRIEIAINAIRLKERLVA